MNFQILLGDWRYFWPETFRSLCQIPSAWDMSVNTGVGIPQVGSLWIVSYLNVTACIGSFFGLSWQTVSLLMWIIPSISLSFLSMYFLFVFLFPHRKLFGLIAAIIYGSNSYFQMVFLGGQIGVSLAYSLLPFVVLAFIRTSEKPRLSSGIVTGLLLAFQVLFDPRIALVSVGVGCLYFIFNSRKWVWSGLIYCFAVPFTLAVLLHSYWILPLIVYRFASLPDGFLSQAGFQFFSFADYSHSLSLLHPNWPENLFGKVSFLRPLFLLFPLLAFSSIVFPLQKAERSRAIFFIILAFFGIFLSKGSNDPFGNINNYLFSHVPFFGLFRDPIKFYIIIAVSYAVLIPITLSSLAELFTKYHTRFSHKKFMGLLLLLFLSGWLFIHRSIVSSTSFLHSVPREYVLLYDFLRSDDTFFRTLWIPSWQRYGYFSNLHPAIGRTEIFSSTDPLFIANDLKTKRGILSEFSVKYVIIPFDSEGELFLNERKYSSSVREKTEKILDTIPWLSKMSVIPNIALYKFTDQTPLFSNGKGAPVGFEQKSQTDFRIATMQQNDSMLIFSQAFDQNWAVQTKGGKYIKAEPFGKIMKFSLPKGDSAVSVLFLPQTAVVLGLLISLASFVICLQFFLINFFAQKKRA